MDDFFFLLVYMHSIYLLRCAFVRSLIVMQRMSLAGFNDVTLRPCIAAICLRTVGDLASPHYEIKSTSNEIYSLSTDQLFVLESCTLMNLMYEFIKLLMYYRLHNLYKS